MAPLTNGSWIWGRSMSKTDEKIRPGAFRAVVKATAAEMGIRNTALQVLYVYLDALSFQNGQARVGRTTLMDRLGRSEKAIKTAMQQLRSAGIIDCVAYPRAAPKKTPVYRFCVSMSAIEAHNSRCKRGAEFSPRWPVMILETRGKNFQDEGQIFPERGEKITPPSSDSQKLSESGPACGVARNDTPSRRDGANVSAEQRAEDTRQFSRWVDQYGYGRAREMERERDAARLAAE